MVYERIYTKTSAACTHAHCLSVRKTDTLCERTLMSELNNCTNKTIAITLFDKLGHKKTKSQV